jgi:hypothetical protein
MTMKKWKTETVEEYGRRVLLTSIAEQRGYRYDPKKGLTDLKTGHFVTDNLNVMAKNLLGQMTSAKDIETMESILTVVSKLYNYEKLVETARPLLDDHGIKLPESQKLESYQTGTIDWFRRLIGMVE